MITLYRLAAPILAGEPLSSDKGPELLGMLVRIGIFLIFLLVFVFVCGYAWRTLPGLRAILPNVEKRVSEPITLNLPDSDEDLPSPSPSVESYSSISTTEPVKMVPPQPEFEKDKLASAIVDGRPGAVIQAASDLQGLPASPIVIVRREDFPQN